VLAVLGGATITLSGCSSPTEPTYSDVQGVVANNHGHAVTITGAQLGARGGVTLSIQGTSSHQHMVELSAVEVNTISQGRQVVKTSTGTSHTHTVTFN
jgi:hypothetical protein